MNMMQNASVIKDDNPDDDSGIDCDDENCQLSLNINLVLATFSIITWVILLYVCYNVFSKIKFNNKIILGMIIFLIMDIFCK